MDNNNDFEILSQLCPSQLVNFPRGQSFTEFFENSNTGKLLTFSDLAGMLLQNHFTELLISDTKIRFEPSLENDWQNPLSVAQYFFDLSDDNVRGQIEAFIKTLDGDFSLGARSHRSLKLFAHLMLACETQQEILLTVLNVKATMRPGMMRDKFVSVAMQILERASRMLNHNII